MNLENTAISNLLKRAVELDNKKRYTESLICYQEGMQLLLNLGREIIDPDRKAALSAKLQQYVQRAEKIQDIIENQKKTSQYHEEILIADNETGFGYETMFGRFLSDGEVKQISVEDPYIRAPHQVYNFVRFCELAVKKCFGLEKVTLTTSEDHTKSNEQYHSLKQLQSSMQPRGVQLEWIYSTTLHDRAISLSNGWIIKLGRGLDFFKSVPKFSIGYHDLDLRPCNETTVNIYHKNNILKK